MMDELGLQLPPILHNKQNTRYQKESLVSNSTNYKGKNKIMFKLDLEKV